MKNSLLLPSIWILAVWFSACQSTSEEAIERPVDPWVMRSVLDQQVRMLTLALHEAGYAAYNTETCALYKVWRGGVHWDGAAFNNVKTVQPESWGEAYWEAPVDTLPWRMEMNGQKARVQPQFKGYRLHNNQITLQYELALPDGAAVTIYEQPEFFQEENGKALFTRTFQTEGIPSGTKIWNGAIPLPFNAKATTRLQFELLPPPDPEKYAQTASGYGSQYWLDRSGCTTCHHEKEKKIGPSYAAIAGKYEQNEETLDYLVKKVKNGGAGVWGAVPMNPHPDIPEDDIEYIVEYILSLEPEEADEPAEDDFQEEIAEETEKPKPGFGDALEGLHPALELHPIRPHWFKPRVGGMDFLPDGRLLVSTWDSIGAVYAISGAETGDTSRIKIQRIATGLSEPLGLKVVEGDIFVLQKHELTQLIDHDGDGVTDEYRAICNSFDASPDFHEFSYGLEYKDGYFYANLGLAMRLMSHELQLPDRGSTIKIGRDGRFTKIMEGVRQANGIGTGPDGDLFITENQGQWVPACKVIHVQEGTFQGCQYGTGDRYHGREMTPPAVWLPQDEIGNSPSQPVLIPDGVYKGQLLHGEVTHGGIKRVFLEKVNEAYQGCAFRFTQGLEAGINRLAWGPDGALYAGGVGMNGNWGWKGKQYGLQRLAFKDKPAFELLAVRALPHGFELEFTEPLAEGFGSQASDYVVEQWRYETTPRYGCPKLELETLPIQHIQVSDGRKRVQLTIRNLKEGFVVYFLLNDQLTSVSGQGLWSGEAWYTLNAIPEGVPSSGRK